MDLTERQEVANILKAHGIYLRKSLGQHFLVNRQILEDIVEAGELKSTDTVIEIGAGIGVLTGELCRKAGKIMSFEMDEKVARILKQLWGKKCANLEIRVEDFLDARLDISGSYKVVSNLPYQITSPVVRRFLQSENLPELMVFLVQKEVAQRLAALPGDAERGWISVLVQLYGNPGILRIVGAENFFPPPEVESAILVIKDISKPDVADIKQLLRVVRAGFSAKRRQLPNALAGGLGIELDVARSFVEKAGIDVKMRAEALTIKEWERLADIVEN